MSRLFPHRPLPEMLPVLLSFSLAAMIIAVFETGMSSIALILGVIAGGLVDLDHRTSGRLKNLIVVLVGFALSSVSVQLTLDTPWAITLVMVILAFSTTMLSALDTRYRTIAFGTLIVAIYTALTDLPGLHWYSNPLMIILGALIYHGVTLVFHLLFPNRPVQEALTEAFRTLAAYVETKARFFAPDERDALETAHYDLANRTAAVTHAFNHCRDALFYRLSNRQAVRRSRRQLRDFYLAQDIHERISAAHVDYRELTAQLAHSDVIFRIERLITLQALACRDYARALLEEAEFVVSPVLLRAGQGLQSAWARAQLDQNITPMQDDLGHLVRNLVEINQQLTRLGQVDPSQDKLDPSIENHDVQGWDGLIQRLRDNLSLQSAYFRHALRLALLTLTSCVIVESLDLAMGYWILLTAVFVCQPNFVATQAKIVQRIIGTLLGVIVGSLLPLLAPDQISLLSLMVMANTLFFYFRASNYGYSTLFITVQVFLGFALVGMDTQTVIASRLLDTVIGAGIAWACVQLLWPDWRYVSLQQLASRALASDGRYLRLVVAQLGEGSRDDLSYRAARRRVHEHASELAGWVADMQQNPEKYGAQLENGQSLVRLNYLIVSQISALAAHRGEGQDMSAETTQVISQLAGTISTWLESLPSLTEQRLATELGELQARLEQLEQAATPAGLAIVHPLSRLLSPLSSARHCLQIVAG